MKVTFLGTGTSQGIPVIGCQCSACKSVDPHDSRLRCAVLVSIGETNICIDIGPDFRQQMLTHDVQHLDAVLITHEHNDHTAGLDDIRPYNYKSQKSMPVYASARVCKDLSDRFSYVFQTSPYPGAPKIDLITLENTAPFTIDKIPITPINILHGELSIFGFRIGGFAYLTDVSEIPESSFAILKGVKVLAISALQFQPHYSHITVVEATRLINIISPRSAFLIHMSHTMGPVNVWSKQLPAHVKPAFDGLTVQINEES